MDFSTPFHSVCIVGCGLSGCESVNSMPCMHLLLLLAKCIEHSHVHTTSDAVKRRLYAARLLRKQFPDLICLEANDRIGGRVQHVRLIACRLSQAWTQLSQRHVPRIRLLPCVYTCGSELQLEDFVAWPVQEGPEFIHGLNAPLRVRSLVRPQRTKCLLQKILSFLPRSLFLFLVSEPTASRGCSQSPQCCGNGLQKLVEEMGMELREYSWPDRWWLGKVMRTRRHHSAVTLDALGSHVTMQPGHVLS